MDERTVTIAEAQARFSQIADEVNATGKPVTVLRNSKPWVVIVPASGVYGDQISSIDGSLRDCEHMNSEGRKMVLSADRNDPESAEHRVGMFADRTLVTDWRAFDSMDNDIAKEMGA